jgi:hypothetical protein
MLKGHLEGESEKTERKKVSYITWITGYIQMENIQMENIQGENIQGENIQVENIQRKRKSKKW